MKTSAVRISSVALLVVLAGIGFCLWIAYRARAALVKPAEIPYPVLLVEGGRIREVCLDMGELVLRPEYSEPLLETDYSVIDARGRRYSIRNVAPAGERPSVMKRLFNATVYDNLRFDVNFDLKTGALVSEAELGMLLEDAESDQEGTSLEQRYIGFRQRRFEQYGNRIDRWPVSPTEEGAAGE